MVRATDSAKVLPPRWAGVGLALVCLLCDGGCARLRSFQHNDRPAFGTETSSDTTRSPRKTGSDDLHAGRPGKARPTETSSLAEEPRASTADADPSTEGPHENPRVVLQPPEGLSEQGGSNRALLAKRTQDVSEASQPRRLANRRATESAGPSLASVLAETQRKVESLTTYQVKMNHQERVSGNLNPAEDVLLSIRRNPRAVRIEWLDGPNQGREVIFVSDANGGLMHVRLANPLLPRMSMPPDSPLATRNSRHPITEAGFNTIIQNMDEAFRRQQANDFSLGRIRYDGRETPDGFDLPCEKVVRVSPTRETWVVYIHPTTHLPALVQATDGNGELLERFVFRDPTFNPPDLALAQAFDPDSRWGPSKGLFQRLARGASETEGSKKR